MRDQLVLGLGNGVTIMIPVHPVEGLAGAAAADLGEIEISPAGHGLHFPRLDADVYAPALMQGAFGSKCCMATRRNGRRGGRPRKEGEVGEGEAPPGEKPPRPRPMSWSRRDPASSPRQAQEG